MNIAMITQKTTLSKFYHLLRGRIKWTYSYMTRTCSMSQEYHSLRLNSRRNSRNGKSAAILTHYTCYYSKLSILP